MTTAFSIAIALAAVYYAVLIGYFAVGFRRVRREPFAAEVRHVGGLEETAPFVSAICTRCNGASSATASSSIVARTGWDDC